MQLWVGVRRKEKDQVSLITICCINNQSFIITTNKTIQTTDKRDNNL